MGSERRGLRAVVLPLMGVAVKEVTPAEARKDAMVGILPTRRLRYASNITVHSMFHDILHAVFLQTPLLHPASECNFTLPQKRADHQPLDHSI